MKTFWSILTLGLLGASALASEQILTYEDLAARLTSMERLATLPGPDENCMQWSSYDRASVYDKATDKYVAWDANGDGDGYIRKEGDQIVMAEMNGPGCIWRIWSAAPKDGHVRIFLDGATQPVVDLPFIGYFDGKNEPFTRSALVHTVAMGWNNYTPIPFQKSCKVVADKNWGQYFHFTYGTFPPGTVVPTFKRTLSSSELGALDRANDILTHPGSDPAGPRADADTVSKSLTLAGGAKTTINLHGQRAITGIRAKVKLPPSSNDKNALRELSIRIRWDNEPYPSVWAPFGDFFGTAAGAHVYQSLPLGLTADGWWYSYWYMPFAKAAELQFANDGTEDREITFEITHAPISGDLSKMARFHAKWHRDALLPADPARQIDWTMLQTKGSGRFCGVMLHVWNPKGGWWGEGDEKFFVDGEKFPSTFGTGSEDYFGYAWCNPTLFENAYHNQTISMNNKGHVSVNRWHITDNIPFHTSFEGDIEKYYPNTRPTVYASTVFWYLAPGGSDPYMARPMSERVGYWTEITNYVVAGAIEGERMKILGCTGGQTQEQATDQYEGQWSQNAHLWWTNGKPGNKLSLAVPVSKTGRYQLKMQMTKARDYGIVQLYLDGEKLGNPVDLYDASVVPTGALDMGAHQLAAGEHNLTLEITGANPKAVQACMAGVDYVLLSPIQ
jgi:hypothetical protein